MLEGDRHNRLCRCKVTSPATEYVEENRQACAIAAVRRARRRSTSTDHCWLAARDNLNLHKNRDDRGRDGPNDRGPGGPIRLNPNRCPAWRNSTDECPWDWPSIP